MSAEAIRGVETRAASGRVWVETGSLHFVTLTLDSGVMPSDAPFHKAADRECCPDCVHTQSDEERREQVGMIIEDE